MLCHPSIQEPIQDALYLPLDPCLFALAAALPAAAQSNVTISGYLDAGVFRDYDKTSKLGTIQRSNLAIAGFEDLGGGLKATFRLSTRFDLDTGLTEDYPKKPFWHDESTVGLQGAWGHLRLGRALSAMWSQEWQFDPGPTSTASPRRPGTWPTTSRPRTAPATMARPSTAACPTACSTTRPGSAASPCT